MVFDSLKTPTVKKIIKNDALNSDQVICDISFPSHLLAVKLIWVASYQQLAIIPQLGNMQIQFDGYSYLLDHQVVFNVPLLGAYFGTVSGQYIYFNSAPLAPGDSFSSNGSYLILNNFTLINWIIRESIKFDLRCDFNVNPNDSSERTVTVMASIDTFIF